MMNVANLKESTRLELRKRCLRSLFHYCKGVMGYDDMTQDLHREVCEFWQRPARKKQLTLPRGFLKTCISSIAFPTWISLPRKDIDEFPEGVDIKDPIYTLGPNIRILICSYVVTNAGKMVNNIKKIYERNQAMQVLFPEVIPQDFTKVKWSDMSACLNRSMDFTESTFEAAGVGGSSVSRHYDIIIEDDLIYAKKDDLSGMELQPGQEDIDKAIGWHKLANSLWVPKKHVMIMNVGTRWAKHDLVYHIRQREKGWEYMDVPAANEKGPTWPELFDEKKLGEIKASQGPYMFATQYMNQPMAPEDMMFKPEWIKYYISDKEVPKTIRKFTTLDLAEWDDNPRKKNCVAVVMTCGWCDKNHLWILHYDIGRFDPSRVIELMSEHWKIFNPELIAVESVYYQKALHHFTRKAMEDGKYPWMNVRQIKPEGNKSKELRIRALEPVASNLAMHCKPNHKAFITEFLEYVPNSKVCRKDILDTLAYQIQVARPGEPLPLDIRRKAYNKMADTNMDEVLAKLLGDRSQKDIFGNEYPKDPFSPEDREIDWLAEVTNPFFEEE